MTSLSLITCWLVLSSYVYQKVTAIDGCDGTDRFTSKGFEADYYHYPLKYTGGTCYDFDNTYRSSDYQHGGYETYGGGYIGSSYGITDLTFSMTIQTVACYIPINGTLPAAFNYPETVSYTHLDVYKRQYIRETWPTWWEGISMSIPLKRQIAYRNLYTR